MLKVSPRKCRVHSLTGRITAEVMRKACKAVKRNRGAAGLDKESIKRFEANREENRLALMRDLKSGPYQAIPLRRVYIPKGKGAWRPLGIPAVRCRVAQEVIRALMEPIFEPTLHDHSHGFRRHRSWHTAMAQLVAVHRQGFRVVVDADRTGFFDSIPHHLILALVAREIADGNIVALIKKFLQAGVMEDGEVRPTRKGTPQGGVISPLLANIVGRLFGRKGTVVSMLPWMDGHPRPHSGMCSGQAHCTWSASRGQRDLCVGRRPARGRRVGENQQGKPVSGEDET